MEKMEEMSDKDKKYKKEIVENITKNLKKNA